MRPRPDHPLRPVATSPITRLAVLIAVAGLASVAVGGGEAPALAQDSANGTAASSSLLGAISPSSSGFGATGQWVFSLSDPAEFPFLLLKNGSNPWHVLVQPSADTFLFPEVSVGGLVKFERNGGTIGLDGLRLPPKRLECVRDRQMQIRRLRRFRREFPIDPQRLVVLAETDVGGRVERTVVAIAWVERQQLLRFLQCS